MTSPKKLIYIVSDGTGETAERVARATVLQFNNAQIDFRVFSRVLSELELREILLQAERDQPFIFYTMVNPEHRELLRALAAERNIDCADLIGSLMMKVANYLGQKPLLEPGLGHQLDEDYFRRVEAVEFAVKNDDGQEPRSLFKADIVLVGLSRTSKTPLSIYLAHKGWKVANVPLVKGIEPPSELYEVPFQKVYALQIGLDALVKIRRARLRHLGLSEGSDYATRDSVADEIRWVQDLYGKHPEWPVFDVTNRAIEETAAEILKVHESRGNSG
jgi:regulator of PEP synthase PpsR (kinase-PPPase family)